MERETKNFFPKDNDLFSSIHNWQTYFNPTQGDNYISQAACFVQLCSFARAYTSVRLVAWFQIHHCTMTEKMSPFFLQETIASNKKIFLVEHSCKTNGKRTQDKFSEHWNTERNQDATCLFSAETKSLVAKTKTGTITCVQWHSALLSPSLFLWKQICRQQATWSLCLHLVHSFITIYLAPPSRAANLHLFIHSPFVIWQGRPWHFGRSRIENYSLCMRRDSETKEKKMNTNNWFFSDFPLFLSVDAVWS